MIIGEPWSGFIMRALLVNGGDIIVDSLFSYDCDFAEEVIAYRSNRFLVRFEQ